MSPPLGNHDELAAILKTRSLSPVFQPIYDLILPGIMGYEALIRGPADSDLHSPILLLETAQYHGRLAELEYACRDVSCERFVTNNLKGKLFLNISPMSLVDRNYKNGVTDQIIRKHNIAADRIVIELSEQYPLKDYDLIRKATHHYRGMGFEIAIDDLGSGYSGLKVWSELRPDYVKIDRHFIENINENPVKREFVRFIHQISRSLNCKVIAEGIETREELAFVRGIGINAGQGFFLGRPHSHPSRNIPACLNELADEIPYWQSSKDSKIVYDMMDDVTGLTPETRVETAADIFQRDPGLQSIPVVDNGRPLGIISRNTILELFLGRYGRELHAKTAIRKFMHKNPIIAEHDSLLEQVSLLITDDPDIDISMDFIIVRRGEYLGVGKVRKLLQKITQMKIHSARYSNPLTQLPGNVPIYEWLDDLLTRKKVFRVAYFDINDFKPYNDTYGYSRGDDVIMKLGEILQQSIDHHRDMVGHIGGDDFVITFLSDDWRRRCEMILEEFKKIIPGFYNQQDLDQGGIYSVDRRGGQQHYPLLSLAVGVVKPDYNRCLSHHDVAALAADAKSRAKKIGGNAIFVSRRRGYNELSRQQFPNGFRETRMQN